jgi:alanine racemase
VYNLSQISPVIGATLRGNRLASATTQPDVEYLLTDSRSLTYANQTLFFALVTEKGDGHRYIPQLYQEGVRAFVVSKSNEEFRNTCPEGWFLVVNNTLTALQKLAAWHRSRFNMPVVGITGSNGKTIVKEWLFQLLHDRKHVVRSPRSFNSQIGVPLSVWQLRDSCDLAIFEAGISKPGEMQNLQPVIRPTIGILTNIGTAHAEGFESQQQKLVEKLSLFQDSDVIIYNADIPGINEALELAGVGARSMAWTMKRTDAQITVNNIRRTGTDTTVQFDFLGFDAEFTIAMTDDASLENAMNCVALLLYIGVSPDEISSLMPRVSPLAMRLEVMEGKQGCMIINDVYNADLTSLEIAMEFQKRRSTSALQPALILSDMAQTGLSVREVADRVARLCALNNIRRFIGIGPLCSEASDTILSKLRAHGSEVTLSFYPTTEDFLASAEIQQLSNLLILLKGARSFRFERISDALQLRRHETILEVNLDAIVHNLNAYRSHLRSDTKMVCMVKAFGYGNGSYELAKTLQDQNVDYLAVAVADEGAELRRQGIHIPIMVMNPEMSAFRTIIENRLEPEIYSFRLLRAFVQEAARMGVAGYPVHIKIDSGMHRLGFQPHEMEILIGALKQQSSVMVRSVFSHFAGADDSRFDDFTAEQIRRFSYCADRLREAFPHQILRHILNSAGIERFPQYQFEMCRLGIGLYGFEASSTDMNLECISTLKSTILQIKEIPASETVGYSRKGVLNRTSRIAMVPIGYADGYDRRLGNGHARMLVHGKSCPTVGNVCMDVTFLDVTDCPEAREGDQVVIFGRDLPISELSDTLGTICYEVMSTMSNRIKRVYYKE